MKIGIHHREGSFSERWIEYCEKNSIDYKIVNAFDDDIVNQLLDCNIFMWHHHHANFKDVMVAKKVLFALEYTGIKVFPDFKTGWHFDDKVAQKYLLESIDAPLISSYIFYDKKQALEWVETTKFPKVFKLKGGAGSSNVKLIHSQNEAKKLINIAFGKGFSQFDRIANLQEKIRRFKEGREGFKGVLKGIVRLIIPTQFSKYQPPEKGYIYFQDFIPNLDSDIRIQVVGNKACGLKRFVRENDFRASGSGNFVEFNDQNIDKKILKIAFEIKDKLHSQCLTLDFIYKNNEPLIVELSYGFPIKFYDNCMGYWDENLVWHEGKFNPQDWIIENLLKSYNN